MQDTTFSASFEYFGYKIVIFFSKLFYLFCKILDKTFKGEKFNIYTGERTRPQGDASDWRRRKRCPDDPVSTRGCRYIGARRTAGRQRV